MTKQTKDKSLSFEKSMDRLEKIVTELEEGNLSLDKSLDCFEEGMQLAQSCEKALNQATGRVEKVMRDFSGPEKIVSVNPKDLSQGDSDDF